MLTRVLRTVPLDTIDGRSQAGVFLRRVRDDLVAHLGGTVNAAQGLLVEECARTALIARAVGDYVLRQETLVRDGALLPVVREREALVASLTRMLATLGLDSRPQDIVPDLDAYLAAHASQNGPREAS
jgi:hypothetical protein